MDLVFSSNSSLAENCGNEVSIYEKCHHNITYATLNFKVSLPSPYNGDVWDYKHTNTESIQKAISTLELRLC